MATDSSASSRAAAPGGSDLPPNIALGSFGRRFASWLIDGLPFPILAIGPAVLLFDDGPTDVLIVVLGAVAVLTLGWLWVSWWMLAHRLGTPGMRAMRLQALQRRTGQALGWKRALARQLVLAALMGTGIGWVVSMIMALRSPTRQGIHDRAAGSVVIDERTEAETEPATLLPLDPTRKGAPPAEEPASDSGTPAASTPDQQEADRQASDQLEPVAVVAEADDWSAPATPVDDRGAAEPAPGKPADKPAAEEGQDVDPPVNPFARPVPRASALTTVMTAIPAEVDSENPPVPPVLTTAESEQVAKLADRPRSGVRWTVDLGGGRIVPLRRVLLIGRNPQAALGEDADVVGVGVHAATVSKTHLAVGWNEDGPWVMDRGSTNGTSVADDEGALEPCAANELVRVREGQIISYGGQQLRIHRS